MPLAYPSNTGEVTVRLRCLIAAALVGSACAAPADGSGEPTAFSEAGVNAFYGSYEAALKAHRRDTLSHYYHPAGATIVFNGERMQLTHAGLDSLYKGPWQGPQFFAFDTLHSQAIRPSYVLVTGGFRWLSPESPDTGKYIYLSVLEQTAMGLRILVEHETLRPAHQP
jgi:hypothetical protein